MRLHPTISRLLLGVSLVMQLFAVPALAGPAETLSSSAQQLNNGQIEAVITALERAADEGQHHPDLSFNRGLAYQRRSATPSERAGDLGQAAAAFAEALAQRPADAEAQRGLEETQLQVARRNSRGKDKDGAQVVATLGLVERALLSLSPMVLFYLSASASLIVSLGIILRLARKETRRLVGTIVVSVGALLLIPSTLAYFARQALFHGAQVAVVVSTQAQVVDESGRRIAGRPLLAESTVVYVHGPERGLLRLVSLGGREYLSLGQVRVVSHTPL